MVEFNFFFLFCFGLFLNAFISNRETKAKLDPQVHPVLQVLQVLVALQETQGKMDPGALLENL